MCQCLFTAFLADRRCRDSDEYAVAAHFGAENGGKPWFGTAVATRFAGDPLRVTETGEQAMSASDIFGVHGTALALRAQRMTVLASNIANAATPGYKARDLDFGDALRRAEAGESAGTSLRFRTPLQDSLDGNTVELATEQTQFAENAIAYRTTLSFLNGRIATLSRALKGE
jgi:flagellar basal-body rod protein FlgB